MLKNLIRGGQLLPLDVLGLLCSWGSPLYLDIGQSRVYWLAFLAAALV